MRTRHLLAVIIVSAAFGLPVMAAEQQSGQQGAGMSSSGTEPTSVEPAGGSSPRRERLDPQTGAPGPHAAPSAECQDCKTVRGKVLTVNQNTILIRDRSKSEVRLTLTRDTIMGQEQSQFGGFNEGDRIEAYVKPNGEVHSISILRPASGRPGPDEIGG
jgi:hypothetical protein